MKYITLIFAFISLYSCGQNIERDLPEKDIYQVVKGNYTTTLNKLKLKGNIKTVIEEYKNSNINDTIINFSKYELTNSDIEKEPWFISSSITKYYKANFNKQGYLTKDIAIKQIDDKDTIFRNYTYNKENLLISEIEHRPLYGYHNRKYIYNEQNHLIKVYNNDKVFYEYEYNPQKMQVKEISISSETDSLETDLKTYDKYGLELSKQHYNYKNEKGDLWVYEYDRTGKRIKDKFKGKDGLEFENKQKKADTSVKIYRLYDKNKNCIERISKYKNGKLAIRTLKIEYY